jgi:hypothetical protein
VEDACATEGEQEARHADVSHENMFSWPERFEVLVKAEHDFYREKWQKRIEREKSHLTSL